MKHILEKLRQARQEDHQRGSQTIDISNFEDAEWTTLEKVTNIDVGEIPHPSKISEEEKQLFINQFIQLSQFLNLELDLPIKNIPTTALFKAFVEKFTLPFPLIKGGQWVIEFCDFNQDPDNCVMSTECQLCKEEGIDFNELKANPKG